MILHNNQKTLDNWESRDNRGKIVEFLIMPRSINWNKIKEIYDFQPKNYEELLSFKGVGPNTIRALALISDLIYGDKPSWEDPIKYSFAHGDNVYIKVLWGDGDGTGWQGPYSSGQHITLSHAWDRTFTPYIIKATAKDINEDEGPEASFPIYITMSKSLQKNRINIFKFIINFQESRPLFLFLIRLSAHPILARTLFMQ